MSIIKQPYEISVWEDSYENGVLQEKKICVIGSDQMEYQGRAIEPHFTKKVDGEKILTFQMYKTFIDNITGEKINNPFSQWLVNERKVKLKYGTYIDSEGKVRDKWYDFIIKQIQENSTNTLCTYTLKDALVQELSKNGFNITLDEKTMNNIGSAKKLAEDVLAETDWTVESEVFVEQVEDALVYLIFPENFSGEIYQIEDQITPYSEGITKKLISNSTLSGKTILGFYSSCKNKPHRFQFIYSEKGYNRNHEGKFFVGRKDDRTIIEKDCQYYIDFAYPELDYEEPNKENGSEVLGLYLPKDFSIGIPGSKYDEYGDEIESDSTLSSWFRGKRYSFAQQAMYVPLLDRYCQKFKREEKIPLIFEKNLFSNVQDTSIIINSKENTEVSNIIISKENLYDGIYLTLDDHKYDKYILQYKITINNGELERIGGHNSHYSPEKYTLYTQNNVKYVWTSKDLSTDDSYVELEKAGEPGETFLVEIIYIKRDSTGSQPDLYIQPNRGLENAEINCTITDLSLTMVGDYLGYTDSEFVSPTLIQNYIDGYNFQSTGGWVATTSGNNNNSFSPTIENVYGRFDDDKKVFISIVDDFAEGNYTDETPYKPYMKFGLFSKSQFVLNAGIRNNRTAIKNMPKDEEWVLDYKIVNSGGESANNDFDFTLGEYLFDTSTGGYNTRTGFIDFSQEIISDESTPEGCNRIIFKVLSNNYTEETFKKNCKVHLKITPNISDEGAYPQEWYIEHLSLYRKSLNEEQQIITPDYDSKESVAAEDYIKNAVVENTYCYFSEDLVAPENSNKVTSIEALTLISKKDLNYIDYKPVYNTGAEKIRTVSVKESNYFNILQTIAETFEVWMDLEITRNTDGSILNKVVRLKNYIGKDNYANFRYGVNLKEVQRSINSDNIVTKLIVKQNANELAKNGFCTIQRAGANPTGENYIYDFQYYHGQGIMDTQEYLDTVYYLEKDDNLKAYAVGKDEALWDDNTLVRAAESGEKEYNPNGYYLRLKKINDSLGPLTEDLAGLQSNLLKTKASFSVAEAMKESASSGIEQVREDFHALTGLYPDEISDTNILKITKCDGEDAPYTPDKWWKIDDVIVPDTSNIVTIKGSLKTGEQTCNAKIAPGNLEDDQYEQLTSDGVKITSNTKYGGIQIIEEWEEGRAYILRCKLKYIDGALNNIGCHASWFDDNKITILNAKEEAIGSATNSGSVAIPDDNTDEVFLIEIEGRYTGNGLYDNHLWIEPNRGDETSITCEISNIELSTIVTQEEMVKDKVRQGTCYLTAELTLQGRETPVIRTYEIPCDFPAEATGISVDYEIKSVDTSRSDVKQYIQEHAIYKQQEHESGLEMASLQGTIEVLEGSIAEIEQKQKDLLEYKQELNKSFFNKYSRFILEGTWIDEEYVDDEKYYADAQAVLYNSCFPQVQYTTNVIFLSSLPGYEHFQFELGDKTYIIDTELFGSEDKQEVIVTEIAEYLDDPSRNSLKVQNFKNQFQDLFRKITATVQQAQYNTGKYERNDELLNADIAKQKAFITNAVEEAAAYLQYGSTVTEGPDGITITDNANTQNRLKLAGGAILLGTVDPTTKENTWRTGLTKDGLSAELIRSGRLDTEKIQIMANNEPVFRWDRYGISAYDAIWNKADNVDTISGINSKKFVRFDKNGIYGINNAPGIDGQSWHPSNINEIDENATFALTWEGLKVTNKYNIGTETKIATARIGNYNDENGNTIIRVNNGTQDTLKVTPNGDLSIAGHIEATSGKIGPIEIQHQNGINLVEFADNLLYWTASGGGEKSYDESDKAFCLTNIGEKNETFLNYNEEIYLDKNKTYVISLYAKYQRENDTEYDAYVGDVFLLGPSGKESHINAIGISDRPNDFNFYSKSFQPIVSGFHRLRIDNNNFLKGSTNPTGVESKLYVRNIKLIEKGLPGALVMWDGHHKDENLVFKVGKNTKGGNEAFIKGQIIAESGQIGNVTIAEIEKDHDSVASLKVGQDNINMRVGKKTDAATYRGTCKNPSNDNRKNIELDDSSNFPTWDEVNGYEDEKYNPMNGFTLLVKFENEHQSNNDLVFYVGNDADHAIPVYYKGKQVNGQNKFSWEAGDSVLFTYRDKHWEADDSGAYAQIRITKDQILSKVQDEYGTKSEIKQTADSINARVDGMVVGDYSGSAGAMGTNQDKNYFTVALATITPEISNDTTDHTRFHNLFMNGRVLEIQWTGSKLTRKTHTRLNIGDADDVTPNGTENLYGYEIKIDGESIGENNVLTWDKDEIKAFKFIVTTPAETNKIAKGYWELMPYCTSQLAISTKGITADSFDRSGNGYGFTLNPNGFFITNGKTGDDMEEYIRVNSTEGLQINGTFGNSNGHYDLVSTGGQIAISNANNSELKTTYGYSGVRIYSPGIDLDPGSGYTNLDIISITGDQQQVIISSNVYRTKYNSRVNGETWDPRFFAGVSTAALNFTPLEVERNFDDVLIGNYYYRFVNGLLVERYSGKG